MSRAPLLVQLLKVPVCLLLLASVYSVFAWQKAVAADERAGGYFPVTTRNCKLAARYSQEHNGVALLVMQGGSVVYEHYHNGHTAATPHILASGTKSFWGVVAVAAAEDGLLDLDEKVCQTIDEWRDDSLKSRITVRQLLNFTDGLEQAADLLDGPSVRDKFHLAISCPANREPGTFFEYGPAHLFVFGELLKRKLAARHEDPLSYLKRRIFFPIGLYVSNWTHDRAGNPSMPAGAMLTARQWSKFGQLINEGGSFNGKQIVSGELLRQCFVGSQANPNYGLTFWLTATDPFGLKPQTKSKFNAPSDTVMAAGAGKQRLFIIRSQDLVVVHQGYDGDFRNDEFLSLLFTGHMPPR